MTTLAIGFGIVWGAVVVYVGWLGHRQRRLLQQCETLQEKLQSLNKSSGGASRAA